MATGSINISSNISRSEMILQSYAPNKCTDFVATPQNGSVDLTWTDPDDYTSTDGYEVIWKYTRVVRKTGSYPLTETDGTIVCESSIKNQYESSPFRDSNVENDVTYYYRLFPASKNGAFCRQVTQVECTPISYKKMTVRIDLNNSNPETCGSYADHAVGMTSGIDSSEWTDFFGYKPCLFKDGKVVGYLNPNDYTKFENGSSADITSGNAGDVMIEFPRRGVKISKSGKTLTVSMTENPNDPDYKYYAHQRGSVEKNYFYLGAYQGVVTSAYGGVRSISGFKPVSYSLTNWVNYSKQLNDKNYGIVSFYQLLFVQVMYVLQFKGNFNCRKIFGYGIDGSSRQTGGFMNTAGLMNSNYVFIKMFGMEYFWGNYSSCVINNINCNNSGVYSATTDDNITDVSKYTTIGTSTGSGGWMSNCIGTSEAGFLPTGDYNGSSSTYFCTYSSSYGSSSSVGASVWALGSPESWSSSSDKEMYGLFHILFSYTRDDTPTFLNARLQYL